jgi:hypothetical protein
VPVSAPRIAPPRPTADLRRLPALAGLAGHPKGDERKRTIFYQYREGRAKRTLKGIDQHITKAEKAIKGQTAVKRNRFVQLTGGTKTINWELEAKTRALAGLKGYITSSSQTGTHSGDLWLHTHGLKVLATAHLAAL